MVLSLEAHGTDFESERLVWQSVVDRIKISQWQAVQFVGADFEDGFAFRFSSLEKDGATTRNIKPTTNRDYGGPKQRPPVAGGSFGEIKTIEIVNSKYNNYTYNYRGKE